MRPRRTTRRSTRSRRLLKGPGTVMTKACCWPVSSHARDIRYHFSCFPPSRTWPLVSGLRIRLTRTPGMPTLRQPTFPVGVPPDELEGGVVLTSEPLVIPVGNGTTAYTSGAETAYIHTMSTLAEQKVMGVNAQVQPLASDLMAKQDQIAQLESRMQALRGSGNIGGYNALVSSHNELVSDYNAELATYRGEVAQGNTYAEIYNYIISHAYDRKGTYAWVMANTPG